MITSVQAILSRSSVFFLKVAKANFLDTVLLLKNYTSCICKNWLLWTIKTILFTDKKIFMSFTVGRSHNKRLALN